MFATALVLIFYEAVIRDLQANTEPREWLLILYGAMLGLPAYWWSPPRNGGGS
jgi:hypothetical protein